MARFSNEFDEWQNLAKIALIDRRYSNRRARREATPLDAIAARISAGTCSLA